MSKLDIRECFTCFMYHAGIMLNGCARALYGAAVAGLAGLAVYGFTVVPTEGGYLAVGDFIVSVATMVVAMSGMYALGTGQKKGAKR